MSAFATKSSVSPEKTRAEIERLVMRHGATRFASGWETGEAATVLFVVRGRAVRFTLPMPDPNARSFTHVRPGSWQRTTEKQRAARHEQAVRSAWRALMLVIKAKLEAVASNITTFEQEFLAHIVLASGDTVGDRIIPALDDYTRVVGVLALPPAGGGS